MTWLPRRNSTRIAWLALLLFSATPASAQVVAGSAPVGGPGPFTFPGPHPSVAVDTSRNIYVTGTNGGAPNGTFAFWWKLNPQGGFLLGNTIGCCGGTKTEGTGIAADPTGNIFVTGNTTVTNLATPGVYQSNFVSSVCNDGGLPFTCPNAYVAKFDGTTGNVVYFTYLGPSHSGLETNALSVDVNPVQAIAVDSAGNAYITGPTAAGFPTFNAFQPSFNGGTCLSGNGAGIIDCNDAFVVKLNPSGTASFYATYLGGTDADASTSIAVDAGGNAYVTGLTYSPDFPVLPGAVQPAFDGNPTAKQTFANPPGPNAFVTILGPTGTPLHSTFLDAAKGVRAGYGIALDGSGDVYVAGNPGVIKLAPALSAAFYAKTNFFGDLNTAIAVNAAGEVWVASYFLSGPSTISKLDATGSTVKFQVTDPLANPANSSNDTSVAVDAFGNVSVAGWSPFCCVPTTTFVVRITDVNTPVGSNPPGVVIHPMDTTTGLSPVTLTFLGGVTQAGTTTLTTSTTGLAPPAGFQLGNPPTYFNLTTTAVFTGGIQICIDPNGITASSRLFHFQNGAWVDVTTSVDPVNQTIRGLVTSLSPFAIMQPTAADTIPPTTTASVSPSPNAAGWNNSNVTVTLNSTDEPGGSGVKQVTYSASGAQTLASTTVNAASVPIVISTEGTTTISFFAADNAGNIETSKQVVVVLDKTPPAITCGTADGLWHAADVSIACNASDAVSGLANSSDASFGLSTAVPAGTETASAPTGTHSVCDVAGNCATAGPIGGNMVDKKPPAISITTPTNTSYLLNQAINANYACTDGGSGVATCIGTVSYGAPFDTASVGSKTFTVNATDKVGNVSPLQSVAYSVSYNLCLLYDPTRSVQNGSTIPLKLQLCDTNNADVSSSVVVLHGVSLVQTGTNASEVLQASGNANPDNDFRFDSGLGPTGGYIFNLSTKGLATGSYVLTFSAGADPSPHPLTFQVR